MIPQVQLSGAQLGVLRFVVEAGGPVPTGPSSNFKQGWVSGQVASALVEKGLLRRYADTVEATAGGRRVVATYLEEQ